MYCQKNKNTGVYTCCCGLYWPHCCNHPWCRRPTTKSDRHQSSRPTLHKHWWSQLPSKCSIVHLKRTDWQHCSDRALSKHSTLKRKIAVFLWSTFGWCVLLMTIILILVLCQNDLMWNVVVMSNLKVVLKVEIFHLRVVSVTQPQFLCKIVHRENGTLEEVNCANIPLREWNMCKLEVQGLTLFLFTSLMHLFQRIG